MWQDKLTSAKYKAGLWFWADTAPLGFCA